MAEILEHKSSRRIGRTPTKVLCHICRNEQELSKASQTKLEETLQLDCNHTRELALPPKPNCVGIEAFTFNDISKRARELFPILPDNFSDREWNEYISGFTALSA